MKVFLCFAHLSAFGFRFIDSIKKYCEENFFSFWSRFDKFFLMSSQIKEMVRKIPQVFWYTRDFSSILQQIYKAKILEAIPCNSVSAMYGKS